ncbi:MAG: ABC transporter substrate-binding protein, partial [Planctomycetota bacterium]
WHVSPDGRHYTLDLRRDVRFSNGDPFDADDVVFSIQAYLDERVGSPQRDLLILGGQPIAVRKIASHTVAVDLPQPYAAAERLFDGLAMLPRRLAPALQEGRLAALWGVGTAPADVVGLGPFRLKEVRPGERVVLERNPYYWKSDAKGTRLPYLDEIVWLVVPSDDAQVLRFQAGELDLLNRVPAPLVPALERAARGSAYAVHDLGASLEYNFLFFNLGADRVRQPLFLDVRFRRAVSLAVDRPAIARLVYGGRATPLWGHVTPGNRLWANADIPKPARAIAQARATLGEAGCRWGPDGALLDPRGKPVTVSLLVAAGNGPLLETATLLQADFKAIGLRIQIVPLEFRALLDRVLEARDYDAALLRLGSGDVDPNGEMNVWPSTGTAHVWNPGRAAPATAWEAEIDRLMAAQLTTGDPVRRKALYDRVQALVAQELPIVPLISPNVVVAARRSLGNLRPAVLDHYTLWNADSLFWQSSGSTR